MSQDTLIPQPSQPSEDIDSLKKENEVLKTALSLLGEKLRLAETQGVIDQAQLHLSRQDA